MTDAARRDKVSHPSRPFAVRKAPRVIYVSIKSDNADSRKLVMRAVEAACDEAKRHYFAESSPLSVAPPVPRPKEGAAHQVRLLELDGSSFVFWLGVVRDADRIELAWGAPAGPLLVYRLTTIVDDDGRRVYLRDTAA